MIFQFTFEQNKQTKQQTKQHKQNDVRFQRWSNLVRLVRLVRLHLNLSSLELGPSNPPSGARAPKGSPPGTPNLDWLVKYFEGLTIPMTQVFKILREGGYFLSVSIEKIIRQKLLLAWLLRKKGTKYTAAELVGFVFNDKVFFPGQRVKMPMGPFNYYYGTIGDVSWSQDGVFLEGNTISFKFQLPDGSFAYSTENPEAIEPWDGIYPKFNPSWGNGGGGP